MSKKNILLAISLGIIFSISSYLSLHRIGGFWTPSIMMIVGVFLISALIAINTKKENGGYASFGNLVKIYAIAIGIASVMGALASVIQLSIMDDTQKEEISERAIDSMNKVYSDLGFNAEQLSMMEDELEDKMSEAFNPSTEVLNYIMNFIFYVLISLIPAAIMKKNPSVT